MVAAAAAAILPFIFQPSLMITSLRSSAAAAATVLVYVFLSDSYFIHLGLTTISSILPSIGVGVLSSFTHFSFFGFYLMCRCHDQYQNKGISNTNIMNTIHLYTQQSCLVQSIATKYGMCVRS